MACTNQEHAWNHSTWKIVVPGTIENIQGPDHVLRKSMKVTTTAFETDADVIQHFPFPEMAALAMIPGTMLHHVFIAQPRRM